MLRLPKAVAALSIVALFSLLVLWYNGHSPFPSSLGVSNGAFSGSASLVQPSPNAHRLPTADSFLSHFDAVTKMKGITIAEAKSGCTWPANESVNFQFTEDNEWVIHDRDDAELAMRRSQWHEFIKTQLLPYEAYKDRYDGRGIVILAGNGKSLTRVRVLLRALQRLNSQLPVEIHYWNDEMTADSQQNLSDMWPNIHFNDLAGPSNVLKKHSDDLVNYQLKNAAVINSRFAEPLLLDSDNIPVIKPESLYDSSPYQEYGTLFWPDIARTRPQNPMWPIVNTKCRMDEYEQESGQLLVDKRRFFYHLQLAAWFSTQESSYYYKFLLGDKDTFRFAWHALQTRYGIPSKWLTSVGTISDDGYYCGHTFAQHHPDGRVAFLHGGLLKAIPLETMRWQRESRGGIFQVYKRSNHDEALQEVVEVGIKYDFGDYLPDKPADLPFGICTEMPQVQARPLDEIVPDFEEIYEAIGGYWMLDS